MRGKVMLYFIVFSLLLCGCASGDADMTTCQQPTIPLMPSQTGPFGTTSTGTTVPSTGIPTVPIWSTDPSTAPTAAPTDPTVPPTVPVVPPTDPTVPPTKPTAPPTTPTVPPTIPTVSPTIPTVPPTEPTKPDDDPYQDAVEMDPDDMENESGNLEEVLDPTHSIILHPEASGVLVKSNSRAIIDYSNTADGYVLVKFFGVTTSRLKAQVAGPTTTYTYNLNVDEWAVFPLSDGNGTYKIKIYENVSGNRYALVLSLTTTVEMPDEFAPFIRPNQYVNYEYATETIKMAASLTQGKKDVLEKVETVYNYVVSNISYDREKADTVKSGYLPDLDAVLATKKGICFDYAALMAGMLRSQGVPCKLVVGYAGTSYHAWISVWSENTGWVDGAVFFDGNTWQRMDPTFASSANGEQWILDYIGDGANYTSKYIY